MILPHTDDLNDRLVASPIYGDTTARALLKEKGFNPEDVEQVDEWGNDETPLLYFCEMGNLQMVLYLISRRGADCSKANSSGEFPMYVAARWGHLKIVDVLFHDGGAHEDVRRVNDGGASPLEKAFYFGHFPVVQWLILNGALSSPLRRRTRSSIHNYTMRRALRPGNMYCKYDPRLTVLAWAQNAVTAHDNITVLLTGTHPKSSLSPLQVLNGKPGLLKVIADYAGYPTPHEFRIFRSLLQRLSAFIDELPILPNPAETQARLSELSELLPKTAVDNSLPMKSYVSEEKKERGKEAQKRMLEMMKKKNRARLWPP